MVPYVHTNYKAYYNIRDGKPRMATSTFTHLPSSDSNSTRYNYVHYIAKQEEVCYLKGS